MMKKLSVLFRVVLSCILVLPATGGIQGKELVKNGGFEDTHNPFIGGPTNPGGDKMFFAAAAPKFWNNAPGSGSNYTYLCAPRTADGTVNGGANPFPVYGPFPYSSAGVTSDAGGNFVQQDGDPPFRAPITQLIDIPKFGDYVVSFDVAAGQQNHPNFTSPTSEWWDITLGSAGTQSSPVYSLTGPNAPGAPATNVGQWQSVSLTFLNVPAGQTLLTFVAQGLPGGQPPVSFLDNVSIPGVPEPGSLLLVGIGLLVSAGFGRSRAKSAKV